MNSDGRKTNTVWFHSYVVDKETKKMNKEAKGKQNP